MYFFKNFIFDWDGTLADSAALHSSAYEKVLRTEAPDLLSRFDYNEISGRPTREVFSHLGIVSEVERERLTQLKQSLYRQAIADGLLETLDGAADILAYLSSQNKKIYLVTGGSREAILRSLAATKLASFFQGVITADDVRNGKPAPDGYKLCLDRYGLSQNESVAIEDAPHGVTSAKAAGLTVIGIHNPALQDSANYWFANIPQFLHRMRNLPGDPQ